MKVSTKQITQTVAPTFELVDLQVMKTHLSVAGTDNDEIISAQLAAARQFSENYLQKSLVQRTYRADLWEFSDLFELPMPPLISVTSVKYYNDASPSVLTTLAATEYKVDINDGSIYRAYGVSFPAIDYRHDAVQITYVSGYASGAAPASVTAAVKLIVGDLFENREGKMVSAMHSTNPTVGMLLDLERELR